MGKEHPIGIPNLPFQLLLVDRNAGMAEAWKREFDSVPDVAVHQGDILSFQADALVSPANSFGAMDGGIDLAYSLHFGWGLQERLQEKIRAECRGELPVGQALMVETFNPDIPWLISAPTMRVPMLVASTRNAYLAFRAVLEVAMGSSREERVLVRSVLCPGLGTGIGRIPFDVCAQQMREALEESLLKKEFRGPAPSA